MDGPHLTLHDLIHAPDKAECVLVDLSPDEIGLIEQTIRRVKKRKNELQADDAPVRSTRPRTGRSTNPSRNEPMVEIRDGVEWVSFVYSHNRVLKRYAIRTDIKTVSLDRLDEQFKLNNCVYPRAHLPREAYGGNRWNYESECNRLGWKLAWLNRAEIAGKRGLIQRAVDSYRNRSPSMRSRRVARQAKLMNGTLRKRKSAGGGDDPAEPDGPPTPSASEDEAEPDHHHRTAFPTTLAAATVKSAHSPKTLIMVDEILGRFRIKINVEAVALDRIPIDFREANTVFPRAAATASPVSDEDTSQKQRWIEENVCNELGWKLAWLNPRYLADKKTLLQRAMDIYRLKFMPALQPRHHRQSTPPVLKQHPRPVEPCTASPAPALFNTAASSSPSATESSMDEFQLLSPSGLFLDSTPSIDPCLILSSPFFPEHIATSSYLDESWSKFDQDDPSVSHYLSPYVNLF